MVTVRSGRLWGNFMTIVAIFSLAIAIGSGFNIFKLISSPVHLVAVLLIIAGSYLLALGIREFAGSVFNMENRPWYGQFSAVIFITVFLAISLGLVNSLASWLKPPSARAITLKQAVHLEVACTLFWILILDRPEKIRKTAKTKESPHKFTHRNYGSMPSKDSSYQPSTKNKPSKNKIERN